MRVSPSTRAHAFNVSGAVGRFVRCLLKILKRVVVVVVVVLLRGPRDDPIRKKKGCSGACLVVQFVAFCVVFEPR